MARFGIRQATEKGFIEMCVPGVCDLSYPTSKFRRGRVQQGGGGFTYYNNTMRSMQNNQMGKVIQLGYFNSGTGQHQSNTVYSPFGGCPAITTITGGGTQQIKVLRKWKRKS